MAKRKLKEHKPLRTVSIDAPSGEGKKMQMRTAMNQRLVLEALKAHRGHIARACADAGINRDTYYEYLKDHDFAGAVEAIKQGITDDYIEALHTLAIDAKIFPAVKYYLDNQGRERGFGQEVVTEKKEETTNNIQISLASLPIETLKQLQAAFKPKDD